MPCPRKTPLVTGEIYHIFNRGIDGRITFSDEFDFNRAYQITKYYRFSSPPMKMSMFLDLNDESKKKFESKYWGEKSVSILCYCFMPNHFHFMLKQETEGGISRFISQFLNSYTRYFNTRNKRIGQLFLDRFKNVLVKTDSQALHLSRYIHLNPYSSGVVQNLNDLCDYKWSSIREYIGHMNNEICDKKLILSSFPDKLKYKKFTSERAEYQKELKRIENALGE